jgi:hypothetical protein
MNETYYTKNEQDKFEPIGVGVFPDNFFKQGATLVIVDGNWRCRIDNIRPNHAAVLASLKLFREQLVNRIIEKSEISPQSKELTPEQLAAWEELKKVLDDATLVRPSAAEIADRALEGFEEKTADLLKDPAIRKAYERLETLIKLKGKQHEESNSC